MTKSLHNARVLFSSLSSDLTRELTRSGVGEQDVESLILDSRSAVIRLDSVATSQAEALLNALNTAGGRGITGIFESADRTADLLLAGTEAQLMKAARACGGSLSTEILQAIEHFDKEPSIPSPEAFSDPVAHRLFEAMASRTLIMGVLNVTPDSFSDGGAFFDKEIAIARGLEMVEQGADIVDVGGESTRPGAEPVSVEEEIKRTVPVIERLASAGIAVSIDTYHAKTAEAALDAGAVMVNDISGLAFDPDMPGLIARRKVPAVLMHIKGTPKDMQKNPVYNNLMREICLYLRQRIADAVCAGVDERLLIIDPGIGFGKTVDHNLEILHRLREMKSIGKPILGCTSRKSTIGRVLGGLPPEERVEGTAATVALSIANGANIVRAHDVKEMARAAKMTDAVTKGLP